MKLILIILLLIFLGCSTKNETELSLLIAGQRLSREDIVRITNFNTFVDARPVYVDVARSTINSNLIKYKFRVRYGKIVFITVKNDTIVSVWRKEDE